MDDDNQIKSTAPEQQETAADTQPTENGQTSLNQNTETDSIIDVIGNGQLTKKVTKIFHLFSLCAFISYMAMIK